MIMKMLMVMINSYDGDLLRKGREGERSEDTKPEIMGPEFGSPEAHLASGFRLFL